MIIGNCPVCGAEMRVGTDMTNADRIRAMTDEELTDWYFDKFFPCAPYCSMLQDGCPEHYDCKICLLEWLKQVVDKDGEA